MDETLVISFVIFVFDAIRTIVVLAVLLSFDINYMGVTVLGFVPFSLILDYIATLNNKIAFQNHLT